MSQAEGFTRETDVLWAAARAAADVVVALPGTGADGQPVEMFFRLIAATGSEGFQMGSRGGRPDEKPIHRVVIETDFYLGTFVVTQEQWAAVWPEIQGLYGKKGPWEKPPGASPSYHKGSGLLPVEQVSWYDAMAFCDWLTRHQRLIGGKCPPDGDWRFCLPTESEWEYACRGGPEGVGRDTEYWNGDGEAAMREVGWFVGNSGRQTHPVPEPLIPGSVEDHPLGLFGLHGNVWEWCHDEWDGGAYRGRVDGDGDRAVEHRLEVLRALAAGGPASLTAPLLPGVRFRVVRGGAWDGTAGWCRSASRDGYGPDDRDVDQGFRVCLVRGPAATTDQAGGGAAPGKRGAKVEQAEQDKAGGARPPSGAAGENGAAGGAQRRAAGSPPAAQPRGRGYRAWLEALWRRMFGGE
ncbi:MAG: formylglycine-generating enzyme family protein [Planctomycetota bacterium]|nr:formylglycine-generating enzyme family protein [Planctomycetota bacterium]